MTPEDERESVCLTQLGPRGLGRTQGNSEYMLGKPALHGVQLYG